MRDYSYENFGGYGYSHPSQRRDYRGRMPQRSRGYDTPGYSRYEGREERGHYNPSYRPHENYPEYRSRERDHLRPYNYPYERVNERYPGYERDTPADWLDNAGSRIKNAWNDFTGHDEGRDYRRHYNDSRGHDDSNWLERAGDRAKQQWHEWKDEWMDDWMDDNERDYHSGYHRSFDTPSHYNTERYRGTYGPGGSDSGWMDERAHMDRGGYASADYRAENGRSRRWKHPDNW